MASVYTAAAASAQLGIPVETAPTAAIAFSTPQAAPPAAKSSVESVLEEESGGSGGGGGVAGAAAGGTVAVLLLVAGGAAVFLQRKCCTSRRAVVGLAAQSEASGMPSTPKRDHGAQMLAGAEDSEDEPALFDGGAAADSAA